MGWVPWIGRGRVQGRIDAGKEVRRRSCRFAREVAGHVGQQALDRRPGIRRELPAVAAQLEPR